MIRTLLAHAIDYAGLFPPASLSMEEAVRNYADYSAGADAWALGRFVVPIARLRELGECAAPYLERAHSAWPLSLLTGAGGADEWLSIDRDRPANATADAIELAVRTPDDVRSAAARLPEGVNVFYEIPIDDDPADMLTAIARTGGKAKVRTGGVTPAAFPSIPHLARFIVACAQAGVPFKATAGLHHALRATYRLTYASDSPRGEMFGFLNVLLAAVFASAGLGVDAIAELLAERDVRSLRFTPDGVTWRGQQVTAVQVTEARGDAVISFGSCSFAEPVNELEEIGLR